MPRAAFRDPIYRRRRSHPLRPLCAWHSWAMKTISLAVILAPVSHPRRCEILKASTGRGSAAYGRRNPVERLQSGQSVAD